MFNRLWILSGLIMSPWRCVLAGSHRTSPQDLRYVFCSSSSLHPRHFCTAVMHVRLLMFDEKWRSLLYCSTEFPTKIRAAKFKSLELVVRKSTTVGQTCHQNVFIAQTVWIIHREGAEVVIRNMTLFLISFHISLASPGKVKVVVTLSRKLWRSWGGKGELLGVRICKHSAAIWFNNRFQSCLFVLQRTHSFYTVILCPEGLLHL